MTLHLHLGQDRGQVPLDNQRIMEEEREERAENRFKRKTTWLVTRKRDQALSSDLCYTVGLNQFFW